MSNNVADVAVIYDANVNEETIDNSSDSIDLCNSNNDLGENGNTIGAALLPLQEESGKFLLPYNAPTYGLELPTCTKNAMIIFNQENFVNPHRKREGSEKDVKNLTETFEKFKFKVFTCEDYKKTELLETLKGFWKRNYDAYGCVCVALLTHGREGQLEASDGYWFQESEFFDCFDIRENKTLAGKPIIIIVQACRGKEMTENYRMDLNMDVEDNQEFQKPRFMYLPTSANMLVFHSCYFNTASVRWPDGGGTLFIRSLCRQINESPELDFESICVQVKREVAVKFNEFDKNQMPVVTSTLIRKLHLKATGANAGLPENDLDPRQMPPAYFLQYFKYIKKCFRFYIQRHNDSGKTVKQLILDRVENDENLTNAKRLNFIKSAYSLMKKTEDKIDIFPEVDRIYFHYLLTGV